MSAPAAARARGGRSAAGPAQRPRTAPGTKLIAGIDEAGLGPLLGPLAIGWTVLRLPADETDPWKLLRRHVWKRPSRRARLVVADSKVVFTRNQVGLERLERTVLGFLSLLGEGGVPPHDPLALLFRGLRPLPPVVERHPWYRRLPALPRALEPATVELSAELLRRRMAARGLELVDAGVRVVPVGELNASLDLTSNKGLTVWYRCLEVLRHLWFAHGAADPDVTVDILGGRSHYAGILRRGFPEARVRVVEETPHSSSYVLEEEEARWLPRRMRLSFVARGEERSFATALASCVAKYARELVMSGFNAFFEELQPDLAPTAGYRGDAHRWLADAQPAIERAGLPPGVLVRLR